MATKKKPKPNDPNKLSDAMQAARLEVQTALESARLDEQKAQTDFANFEGKAEDFMAMQEAAQKAALRAQKMEAAQRHMKEIIALLHGAPGFEVLHIAKDGTITELSEEEVKAKQRDQRRQRMLRRTNG